MSVLSQTTQIRKSYISGSQTDVTWLTNGGMFNSWEEICSREELGRKAVDEKTLSFYYLFIGKHQHIKSAQRCGFRWEGLQ